KLRSAPEPRRGGARKRLPDRQNAGRRVAEICEPAAALRLYVRATRQEIALYGLRVRPGERVVTRSQPRLGRAAVPGASRTPELGRATEPPLSQRTLTALV